MAVQYYWELVYAWQNLGVQKEAVRMGTEQYESNPVFREAINAVAARLAAEEKDEGEAA